MPFYQASIVAWRCSPLLSTPAQCYQSLVSSEGGIRLASSLSATSNVILVYLGSSHADLICTAPPPPHLDPSSCVSLTIGALPPESPPAGLGGRCHSHTAWSSKGIAVSLGGLHWPPAAAFATEAAKLASSTSWLSKLQSLHHTMSAWPCCR